LGRPPEELEPTLARLLGRLDHWLAVPPDGLLEALRARDALLGRQVHWQGGSGRADGIDDHGRLVVLTDRGRVSLDAGDVHLGG
jgi:BirA family biotin operon repressor/biotin-[acetyl-CoA-carboxylase] ligase